MTVVRPEDLLTDVERRALACSSELSGLLRHIIGDGPQAANDWAEAAHHIHVLQRYVMSQAAARAFPTEYRALGGSLK